MRSYKLSRDKLIRNKISHTLRINHQVIYLGKVVMR